MKDKNRYDEINQVNTTHTSRGSWWIPVLAVGLLAIAGFTFYQNSQMETLRRQTAASQQDNAALRSNLSSTDSELQRTLEALQSELASTRKESSTSLARAQTLAKRHADSLVTKIQKEQQEQSAQFTAELSKVKESTDETANKISSVNTEVGAVKTDVETTKQTINSTIADLQRVRGDMGVMSGLIATNSKEVQALSELGDRNIYEFTLAKKAGLQRVGDIQIQLKKADVKRNRYTLEVLADDKKVEKKEKGTNEPVQFYVLSKARQPYELVINEVKKDTVVGYLATPKVSVSRSNAAAGGSGSEAPTANPQR